MKIKRIEIYVVGFLFSDDDSAVVLIEKQRPEWAVGKLNGIGGKIEAGESPEDAMAREFFEETGAWYPPGVWRRVGQMLGDDCWLLIFETQEHCQPLHKMVKTKTDERVEVLPVNDLHFHPLVRSARWMIPLSLDRDKHAQIQKLTTT